MTPALFLAFLVLTAMGVVAMVGKYLSSRATLGVRAGLLIWFTYVGVIGSSGILSNTAMRPPGILLIVVPVILLMAFFLWKARSPAMALAFPLWILLGAQVFRVGVELFLHRLWVEGLVPRVLTFAGANVDILIGASAPVAAWLAMRGPLGLKLALGWNALGLLALANVVTRSVLTAPGPLRGIEAEVPNLMMSTFPYVFIPAFFVPLALALHALAIRSISSKLIAGR